jgi:hypothetical protein
MATGNQVVPGAPASADEAAAGPPVTAEHAPRAAWPFAAAQTGGIPAGGHATRPGNAAPSGFAEPGDLAGDLSGDEATRGAAGVARPWAGAGGRWLVWAFRIVLWTVLLLIGYRGIAAIVMGAPGPGATTTPPAGPVASGGGQPGRFPVAAAQAYALEFGQVYLNFNPEKAARRARSLAAFLPRGSDPMFGWNGAAARTLQSEQVAGIRVAGAHRAVVTLLARVNGGLIELGVPIYARGRGMVVSGYPALLPGPARVIPPHRAHVRTDSAAKRSLTTLLPDFLRAYAGGDRARLREFTAGHRPLRGLGGAVSFAGISRLDVPAASGPARRVTVTVVWKVAAARAGPADPPAELAMSYAMTVVRHRASWLVRSISASAIQPWPAP